MMSRPKWFLLTVLLLVGPRSWAEDPSIQTVCRGETQASYLWLQQPLSAPQPLCDIALVGPAGSELQMVEVWVATTPIHSVRLSIPEPPVGTLVGASWAFPHEGDVRTGVALDLQNCTSTGNVRLGTLWLKDMPTSLEECALWRIDDGAEVDYCNGETRVVQPWHQQLAGSVDCPSCISWQWCSTLPEHDLAPSTGATDVPVDVELSCCYGCDLFITTDPNCSEGDVIHCEGSTLKLEGLEPRTTYYWQVNRDLTGDGCANSQVFFRSALHTFTTGDPVQVTARSWSMIKKLYR